VYTAVYTHDVYSCVGEAFFTDNIRKNAPNLSNKIPGKVKKVMHGNYSAFSDDTLDLARDVISSKDSHEELSASPFTKWAGFLLMLQTAVKVMNWLQWPQYPSKNIPKGQSRMISEIARSFLEVI
jgi:hypothetical protein